MLNLKELFSARQESWSDIDNQFSFMPDKENAEYMYIMRYIITMDFWVLITT